MHVYVDGGCRYNGQKEWSYGAAAAVLVSRSGQTVNVRSECMFNGKRLATPTSHRAEISAVIQGLLLVLESIQFSPSSARSEAIIFSDHRDIVNVMRGRLPRKRRVGKTRSKSTPDADLFRVAAGLRKQVLARGRLTFVWVPRSQNTLADWHCNEVLDTMY